MSKWILSVCQQAFTYCKTSVSRHVANFVLPKTKAISTTSWRDSLCQANSLTTKRQLRLKHQTKRTISRWRSLRRVQWFRWASPPDRSSTLRSALATASPGMCFTLVQTARHRAVNFRLSVEFAESFWSARLSCLALASSTALSSKYSPSSR